MSNIRRGCNHDIQKLHKESRETNDPDVLRGIIFELSAIASSLNINEIDAKDEIKELKIQLRDLKEHNYDR